MSLASTRLRRADGCYVHFCPGCEERHLLPDNGWEFNGKIESPSFRPSFKHTFTRFESYDDRGVGIGPPLKRVCHYIVADGHLQFQIDCWHGLKGQTVPLPDLPTEH